MLTRGILIRVSLKNGKGENWTFEETFVIGRDEDCDVQIDSHLVSRSHLQVTPHEGGWIVRDLRSSNGTFVDGEAIREVPIKGTVEIELGRGGPVIQVEADSAQAAEKGRVTRHQSEDFLPPVRPSETGRPSYSGSQVDEYAQKYFQQSDGPAGDHTRMMREAYTKVSRKSRRGYFVAIGVVTLLFVAAIGYVMVQQARFTRLEAAFRDSALELRELDAEYFRLKSVLQENEVDRLGRQRDIIASRRQKVQEFIVDMGVHRRATPRELAIFKVALIFNENHVDMPAGFVRAVNEEIKRWQSPGPRRSYENAIANAEKNGYTAYIVNTFRKQGLPVEFFYLGLQESELNPERFGPRTNCCGVAKGMWQFIIDTGETYGLRAGTRSDERVYDPSDERHDFYKSTEASARYLSDIYGELAQSSGLLAMASYNWGEHRVVPKLKQLLQGIPDDVEARSYWKFYSEYAGRMPDETKDYVLRIFAAAVIGQDPKLFGFDIENPLEKYVESVE